MTQPYYEVPVPWKLDSQQGPTYYVGLSRPVAVEVADA